MLPLGRKGSCFPVLVVECEERGEGLIVEVAQDLVCNLVFARRCVSRQTGERLFQFLNCEGGVEVRIWKPQVCGWCRGKRLGRWTKKFFADFL